MMENKTIPTTPEEQNLQKLDLLEAHLTDEFSGIRKEINSLRNRVHKQENTQEDIHDLTHVEHDYICDDRNVHEDYVKIQSMTDEEFEEHIRKLKEKESKSN